MEVAVTTSRDDILLLTQAQKIARELGIPFLPREKKSLEFLRQNYSLDYLLVVEQQRLVLKGESKLFWHPSMAVPRLKALREGGSDPLVEALRIQPGTTVLDCTLGLAADALVAAYAAGSEGSVTGLEANKYLAYLTKWGLEHYDGENKYLLKASKRITVINSNYKEYLEKAAEGSFEVVYFDPMFEHGLYKSSAINALRPLAVYDNLTKEDLVKALRVARNRVVVKQAANNTLLKELDAQYCIGRRSGSVTYGIWVK